MFALILSKEHIQLAKAEIIALSKTTTISENETKDIIFLKESFPFERLTLTQEVYESKESFEKTLPYNTEITIKRFQYSTSSPEFQKVALECKNKNNSFNLRSPKETYGLIKKNTDFFFGKRIFLNKKEFLQRDPKKRPGFHPGACTAKFAKILVNLSGVLKGKILDPFCGTGGILIEGHFAGLDIFGVDLSNDMIKKTKVNCSTYKIPAKITQKNALEKSTYTQQYDAIVTEVPFGKTTILDRSISSLVEEFLIVAKDFTQTIVLSLPKETEIAIKEFRIDVDETWYIHKSLSKRILVLKKQ